MVLTLSLVLAFVALLLCIGAAINRVPLWVATLLLAIVALLNLGVQP